MSYATLFEVEVNDLGNKEKVFASSICYPRRWRMMSGKRCFTLSDEKAAEELLLLSFYCTFFQNFLPI